MKDIIKVSELNKTFQAFDRREGVSGAIKDLFHRTYHDVVAVNQISFTVGEGELLGFIGPNGAGKSTSIKMLTGILKPTSGEISVLGFHPYLNREEYVKHIGVVFGQRTQLWWDIAVIESLKLLGSVYEVPEAEFKKRMEKLTDILELKEFLHTPVRKLSLGQRMRSDLAASLIHDPKVLFLDEPTVGLDAVGKESVRKFLKEINRDFGTTIILTTHDLKEIEELCKRIIIVDKGKIVFNGDLSTIKSIPGLKKRLVLDFRNLVNISELSKTVSQEIEQLNPHRIKISYDPDITPTVKLIEGIFSEHEVIDLTIEEPDIEEIIMKIYREGV
jgi:ABC-2 type transport system ATP-binding protein